MGLNPKERILFFNQFGLSWFFIFLIRQLPNIVQACPLFFSIFTFKFCFTVFFVLPILFSINFPKPLAERSLAIPLIPKQSGLFGVIDNSITFSKFLLKYLFPIFFFVVFT